MRRGAELWLLEMSRFGYTVGLASLLCLMIALSWFSLAVENAVMIYDAVGTMSPSASEGLAGLAILGFSITRSGSAVSDVTSSISL